MYDWSSNKRSGTIGVGPLAGAVVNFNNQWFDTLTARIGYSFAAPWLFYFQGGGAWSHTSTDAHDRNIVTAGAPCPPPGCFFNTKATEATVLVGVNYRFW